MKLWNENVALSLFFFDTFHFPLFPSRPWQRVARTALSGIFHPNRILLQSATARYRFSALWLRSKLVTVLIELTFDISSTEESKVVWFLEAWLEPGLAPTDHGSFQRGTRAGHGPHPRTGWNKLWNWIKEKKEQFRILGFWTFGHDEFHADSEKTDESVVVYDLL